MAVVLDFSLLRMLVRLGRGKISQMRAHMSMLPTMTAVLCRCSFADSLPKPKAGRRQLEQIIR